MRLKDIDLEMEIQLFHNRYQNRSNCSIDIHKAFVREQPKKILKGSAVKT